MNGMQYLERPHLKLAERGGNLTKYHANAVDHWQIGTLWCANHCTKRVKRPTQVADWLLPGSGNWPPWTCRWMTLTMCFGAINSNQSVVCSLLQNVVYVSQWNDPCRHMPQNYAYIMAYVVDEVFIVRPKTAYSGLENIIKRWFIFIWLAYNYRKTIDNDFKNPYQK